MSVDMKKQKEYFLQYDNGWETVRLPFCSDKEAWEELRNLRRYAKTNIAILYRNDTLSNFINRENIKLNKRHKQMTKDHWIPIVMGNVDDAWDLN